MSRPQCPYEYDNAGRLLKTTNALGTLEHFAYDTLGNLIARRQGDGSIVLPHTIKRPEIFLRSFLSTAAISQFPPALLWRRKAYTIYFCLYKAVFLKEPLQIPMTVL